MTEPYTHIIAVCSECGRHDCAIGSKGHCRQGKRPEIKPIEVVEKIHNPEALVRELRKQVEHTVEASRADEWAAILYELHTRALDRRKRLVEGDD